MNNNNLHVTPTSLPVDVKGKLCDLMHRNLTNEISFANENVEVWLLVSLRLGKFSIFT
jgi:hypothetical protein